MEVNGKEFLRNVSIEQDKADLAEQRQKLDEQKRDSLKKTPDYFDSDNIDDESAYVNISNNTALPQEDDQNNLFDIKLDTSSTEKNKKKYIILGLSLVILFILTIIVIRVISNNEKEEQINPQSNAAKEINKDKILDKIDSIEEYQKVIGKVPKPTIETIEKKDIILPEPTKDLSPVIIDKPVNKQDIKRDLFELEKPEPKSIQKVEKKPKPVIKPKPTVKPKVKYTAPKKTTVVAPPKVTNFTKKSNSKVQGYYIQIGAYTKKPNNKFLNSISKKGYRYAVHQVVIKGKNYNKVLIGSYPTKNLALKVIKKVKKDFNNPNAYILKF